MHNFTFKETIFFCSFCMLLNLPFVIGNSMTNDCFDEEVIELQSDYSRHTVFLSSDEKVMTVCNLKVGKKYSIILSSFDQAPDCIFEITHSKDKRLASYISENNILEFKAVNDCMEFVIRNSNCITNTEYPIDVSISCKNGNSTVQNLVQLAGITTDPNYSAQQLIEDVFIGGGCFEIANVAPIGNTQGIGYFSNGGSSVSIDDGVILASGVIANAHGPNDVTNITTDFGDSSGDPDLNILSGGSVYDAVGIEFDFTPTLDMIEFNYVFASDEYCDYVFTQFNDAFGFFISGPGFSGPFSGGAENIALVPGTSLDVSINNVNIETNSAYYVDNVPLGQPQQGPYPCTIDLSQQGYAINDCEYDGFTVVLTAVANVQVCETYHIRLVVGDVSDGIFDSAVFLEANSFSAGGEASISFDIAGVETNGVAYEGCSGGYIIFERPGDSNLNEDLVVEFEIDPNSSATNGVDFTMLPSSITIPAGQTQYLLPFDIFNDDLTEGIETLILNLSNPCTCDEASIELQISDVDPLEVFTPDFELCSETIIEIPATVSGGVLNYTYLWSNGGTTPTITVIADVGSTFTVTVTDECGNTGESTSIVTVGEQEFATIDGFVEICGDNSSGTLTITFDGQGPWDLVILLDGNPVDAFVGITDNPFFYTVTEIGTYTIGSLYVGPCEGVGSGAGIVIETIILLFTVPEDVSCFGLFDGSVDLTIVGGTPEFTYEWSNDTYEQDPINLSAGIYFVTVTDLNGCTEEATVEIIEPDEIIAFAVETQGVNCVDPNSGAADLTVTGGYPIYSFEWDNGSFEEDPTNLNAGLHTVTVTDSNGCTEETSVEISVESTPPLVEAEVSGILTCVVLDVTIDGSNSSGNDITFEWFDENNVLISNDPQINVNEIGPYTLVVTNADNGCTADTTIVVQGDILDPTAEAGESSILNCNDIQATLDGSGSSNGNNFTYSWLDESNTIISDQITVDVNVPGTYTLIVTNVDNGCTSTDQVTIDEDIELPIPVASVDNTLTCTTTDATLDGSGSSANGPLAFQWLDESNTEIADSVATIVSSPGTYTLIVTNTENGCTDQTSIEVLQDIVAPTAAIVEPDLLNCSVTTIQLDANPSNGPGAISYQWLDSEGNEIGDTVVIDVSNPDTYTLIVTNTENGCTDQTTVLVEQDIEDPVPVANVDGILTCTDQLVLLDGSSSEGNGNLQFEWFDPNNNSLGTDPSIEVDAPGTYTLFITNVDNGCTAEDIVEVEQDIIPPVADPGESPTLDCAVTVVTLDGSNSSSNNGAIEYQWLDINDELLGTTPTIEVDSASIYTLLVTAENGCTDSEAIEVFIDTELPNADPGEEGTLNCEILILTIGGPETSIGLEISYQWFNSNNELVGTDPTLDVNIPDTYTLEVLNTTNSCMTTASVVIDQNIENPIADAGEPEILTCNLTEIMLGGQSSSTGDEFIYEWFNTSNQLVGNDLNLEVNEPGDYTLLVTNIENGCTAASSVTIDQDIETPIADAGQGGILSCDITSVFLNGSNSSGNNLAFQWYNQSGSVINDQPQVQVSETGEYTLVVTNTVNGCSSSAIVEVIPDENLPTAIIAGGGILTCNVTDVTLDGSASSSISGQMSLEWLDPNDLSLGSNPNVIVSEPGIYTLVVTDDDNGCTISALVDVPQDISPPVAEAGENDTLSCTLTELMLFGSGTNADAMTYEWLDGLNNSISSNQSVIINSPGIYTLVVTNTETGCTGEDEVEVVPDMNLPIAVAGPGGTLTCIVDAIILDASGSTQGNNFNYEWQSPGGNIISTALQVEVNQPGTYTIIVTNDYNGCTTQDEVDVLQDIDLPVSDITGIGPLEINCDVSSVILDGSGSAPFGVLDFEWSTVDGNIVTDLDIPQVEINQAGTYVLTVTNLVNGCTDTATFEITDNLTPPSAVINPPPVLTCTLSQIQLNAINTSGSGTFVFLWSSNPAGGIVSGGNTLNPVVNQSGEYTLTILNQENGCESTAYIIVDEDIDLPDALASVDDELDCVTEEVQLDGSGSSIGTFYNYQWIGTGITQGPTSLQPTVNQSGTYTLIVTNTENACTNSADVFVNENTNVPSDVDVLVTPPPCVGDDGSIEIVAVTGGEGPYLYSIDGGLNFYNLTYFAGLYPGTYPITIQDAIGCVYEDQIYIPEALPIYVVTEVDIEIQLGDTVQLEALVNVPLSEIDTIFWTPSEFLSCSNCLQPYAFPSDWTDFTITVINNNGCIARDQITLRVKKDRDIYIPNAFTPHNNDGINDVFMIFSDGKSVKNINTFQVFDRWGEKVFEDYNFMPDDPSHSWNGWLKEEPMNPAVFVYWAEIEFIDGVVILYKGDVTLLR